MTEAWIIALLAGHFYLVTLALCEIEYAYHRGLSRRHVVSALLLLLPEVMLLVGAVSAVFHARRSACRRLAPLPFPKVTGERHSGWQCRDCRVGGAFVTPFGALSSDDAASHAIETGHRVEVTERASKVYERREVQEDPHGA